MSKKILLVENERSWQDILKNWILLQEEVTIRSDLNSACSALKSKKIEFDIVIVNLHLQDKASKANQGLCFLNFIRTSSLKLPVILITGEEEKTFRRDKYKKIINEHKISGPFYKWSHNFREDIARIVNNTIVYTKREKNSVNDTEGVEQMILESLTTSTVSAVIKFLFDRLGNMVDHLNENQLENIRQKEQEVERLREEKDIQSIKNIMSDLIAGLPPEIAFDSKIEFKAWVHDQVTAEYADLPSVGKLLYGILMKEKDKESTPQKKDEFIRMATAVNADSSELISLAKVGDATKDDRRNLHRRIIKALDLL